MPHTRRHPSPDLPLTFNERIELEIRRFYAAGIGHLVPVRQVWYSNGEYLSVLKQARFRYQDARNREGRVNTSATAEAVDH